jgi:hypothetical protein
MKRPSDPVSTTVAFVLPAVDVVCGGSLVSPAKRARATSCQRLTVSAVRTRQRPSDVCWNQWRETERSQLLLSVGKPQVALGVQCDVAAVNRQITTAGDAKATSASRRKINGVSATAVDAGDRCRWR